MAEVKTLARVVVGTQQVAGEVIHLAVLQIVFGWLILSRRTVGTERINPDEKMGERHVEHRAMGRFAAGNFGEGLETGILPRHIGFRLTETGLSRDGELHDA